MHRTGICGLRQHLKQIELRYDSKMQTCCLMLQGQATEPGSIRFGSAAEYESLDIAGRIPLAPAEAKFRALKFGSRNCCLTRSSWNVLESEARPFACPMVQPAGSRDPLPSEPSLPSWHCCAPWLRPRAARQSTWQSSVRGDWRTCWPLHGLGICHGSMLLPLPCHKGGGRA